MKWVSSTRHSLCHIDPLMTIQKFQHAPKQAVTQPVSAKWFRSRDLGGQLILGGPFQTTIGTDRWQPKKLNLMKSNSLHWIHRKVLFTWMNILFFLPAHKLFTKMLANRYAIHSVQIALIIQYCQFTPLWNRFPEARISNDSNILTKVNGRYWC